MKIKFNITKRLGIKKDIITMLIVILLPFVFYLYNLVPKVKKWKTDWFEINSGYYEDLNFYFWIICVKLLTLSILSIWFVTCKYSWRYILIIPIMLEVYKIFINIMGASIGFYDQIEFSKSLIFSMPYILILIILGKRIGYYKKNYSFSILVNQEINNLMIKLSKYDTKNYKDVKKELNQLVSKKKEMDKKKYLVELIALRDKLSI